MPHTRIMALSFSASLNMIYTLNYIIVVLCRWFGLHVTSVHHRCRIRCLCVLCGAFQVLTSSALHASAFGGGGGCEARADRWWCHHRATPRGRWRMCCCFKTVFTFSAATRMHLICLSLSPTRSAVLPLGLQALPANFLTLKAQNSNLKGIVWHFGDIQETYTYHFHVCTVNTKLKHEDWNLAFYVLEAQLVSWWLCHFYTVWV